MNSSHDDCIEALAEERRIIGVRNSEIEERNIILGQQQGYIQTLENDIKAMKEDLTVKNEALTVMQESLKPQEYQVWFGLFTALIGARDVHHSKIELNHLAEKADAAAVKFWERFDSNGCDKTFLAT